MIKSTPLKTFIFNYQTMQFEQAQPNLALQDLSPYIPQTPHAQSTYQSSIQAGQTPIKATRQALLAHLTQQKTTNA